MVATFGWPPPGRFNEAPANSPGNGAEERAKAKAKETLQ